MYGIIYRIGATKATAGFNIETFSQNQYCNPCSSPSIREYETEINHTTIPQCGVFRICWLKHCFQLGNERLFFHGKRRQVGNAWAESVSRFLLPSCCSTTTRPGIYTIFESSEFFQNAISNIFVKRIFLQHWKTDMILTQSRPASSCAVCVRRWNIRAYESIQTMGFRQTYSCAAVWSRKVWI